MGMIKRMLKRTSRKLMAKIVPPTHSQQLVLNPPLQATCDVASISELGSKRKLAASLHKKLSKRSSKDTTVAQALLLAVQNHLPPVQFHHVHGPNVQLTKNKCLARRTQSFCQALVFSNRIILPNERVYIKVLEIAKGWSGTIRFGFTAVDPATLACRMPKHACPDMTHAGHTWARALADEVVKRNSVIHFSYNKNGLIHYGINNQDCGVFHANVSTNQNLWFIVDIYGLTAAVELIDPRVTNAISSDEELDQQVNQSLRSTMFKSTSAMDEIFGRYSSGAVSAPSAQARSRSKKQSRKLAARQAAALMQTNWAFENSMGAATNNFLRYAHNQQYAGMQQQQQQQQLPNLNSINLPSAQQNIYSPMPIHSEEVPAASRAPASDSHDYHQIYKTTCPQGGANLCQQMAGLRLGPSVSMANVSLPGSGSSANNNSFSSSSSSSNVHEQTVSSSASSRSRNSQSSGPKSSRTKAAAAATTTTPPSTSTIQSPVAASGNKRPQQPHQSSSVQTNQKRPSDRATSAQSRTGAKWSPLAACAASPAQSATKWAASSGVKATKTRHHSITNKTSQKSAATSASDRDKNNNSPPSKDCPICFERPINCVLYQCGHMCTCYECGVKQWKTQSRTCPICRTIIKDVIKTYMS